MTCSGRTWNPATETVMREKKLAITTRLTMTSKGSAMASTISAATPATASAASF